MQGKQKWDGNGRNEGFEGEEEINGGDKVFVYITLLVILCNEKDLHCIKNVHGSYIKKINNA